MPSFSKLTLLALAASSIAIANATNGDDHTTELTQECEVFKGKVIELEAENMQSVTEIKDQFRKKHPQMTDQDKAGQVLKAEAFQVLKAEAKKVRKATQQSLVQQKMSSNSATQKELAKPHNQVLYPDQEGVVFDGLPVWIKSAEDIKKEADQHREGMASVNELAKKQSRKISEIRKRNEELEAKARKPVQENAVRQKMASVAARQEELAKPIYKVLIPDQEGVMMPTAPTMPTTVELPEQTPQASANSDGSHVEAANDNSASVTSTFMSLIGIVVAVCMII